MSNRELVNLSSVMPVEPLGFLWEDRIPLGSITTLDGDPGQGKSTLLYDIAARVSVGKAMPCSTNYGEPAGVVLLQAEDSLASTVLPSLKSAGADISRIIAFDKDRFRENPFLLPNDLLLLEQAITEVSAKLVVIDPLIAFLAGNSHSDQSVRRAVGPLAALAERTKAAVILVRHLRKSGSRNPLYAGTGSIGVIATARSGLLVASDPMIDEQHHKILAVCKSNVADASPLRYKTVKRADQIQIEWLGSCDIPVEGLTATIPNEAERCALDEAKYVLYSILSDGPITANEVIRLARQRGGVTERTLKRAKKQLQVKSRKRGSGKGSEWFWELPINTELQQPFKDRAIDDLMYDLIYGEGPATNDGKNRSSNDANANDDIDDGDLDGNVLE